MKAAIIAERSGNIFYLDGMNVLRFVGLTPAVETPESLKLIASRLGVMNDWLEGTRLDNLETHHAMANKINPVHDDEYYTVGNVTIKADSSQNTSRPRANPPDWFDSCKP